MPTFIETYRSDGWIQPKPRRRPVDWVSTGNGDGQTIPTLNVNLSNRVRHNFNLFSLNRARGGDLD